MNNEQIKKEFISRLPKEATDRLSKLHLQIIDEGIEVYSSGKSTLNDKIPETNDEWYIALSLHFITAVTAYEGILKGAREAFPDDDVNITVNYRDEKYEYHYKKA